MPRISQFYGISIYMYYRDHAPPHFHAFYGDDEALVEIASGRMVVGDLPRRARQLVEEWAGIRRVDLQEDWDRAIAVNRSCRCRRSTEEGTMILRIRAAEVRGPHSLWLSFNDGVEAEVDLLPILDGPVFVPLRDPEYIRRVRLDSVCGTVIWPNGADFAPEALHSLVEKSIPA
jgi:Domain of unknown function (DUF4160)/Protein of unknown function (DUF2442)